MLKKNYVIRTRSLLSLDTENNLFGETNFALNEIAVIKKDTSSMIKIDAYLDDKFLNYVVEDFPIRLVALDSVAAGERKGVFCAQRLAWLENTLVQEPEKSTVLFIHHPPLDISDHYLDGYRNPTDTADLRALVSRHSQVKGLLCGHVHFFHCEPWAGTMVTTMPSVALDLRKEINSLIEVAPSYLLHFTSEKGRLVTRHRISTR